MIDRHHLLECILWPNGDGTFRKIINKSKRLKDLGVYKDYKLVIKLDRSTHQTMHREFEKGTEYSWEGEKNPMYGKEYLKLGDKNPMFGKYGEKNPWYGKGYLFLEDKSPRWKGEDCGPSGLYRRAIKRYKRGEITEEELQVYRDLRMKYINERKLKCQH